MTASSQEQEQPAHQEQQEPVDPDSEEADLDPVAPSSVDNCYIGGQVFQEFTNKPDKNFACWNCVVFILTDNF